MSVGQQQAVLRAYQEQQDSAPEGGGDGEQLVLQAQQRSQHLRVREGARACISPAARDRDVEGTFVSEGGPAEGTWQGRGEASSGMRQGGRGR